MISIGEFAGLVGQEIGLSDWITVDQDMINRFAGATGDHQFIHVDPERARDTPFGGTIAHGFLTLSLAPQMRERAGLPHIDGVKVGINVGCNKVRFLSPVRSGSRVRGRFVLRGFDQKTPDRWQETADFVVEIEGGEGPALIAEWLTQVVVEV
jgi:acyl dehydratase